MQGSVDCSALILLHWFALNEDIALGFHLSLLASMQCLYFIYFIFSPSALQVLGGISEAGRMPLQGSQSQCSDIFLSQHKLKCLNKKHTCCGARGGLRQRITENLDCQIATWRSLSYFCLLRKFRQWQLELGVLGGMNLVIFVSLSLCLPHKILNIVQSYWKWKKKKKRKILWALSHQE